MNNLSQLMHVSEIEIIKSTGDRRDWKTMIANDRNGTLKTFKKSS